MKVKGAAIAVALLLLGNGDAKEFCKKECDWNKRNMSTWRSLTSPEDKTDCHCSRLQSCANMLLSKDTAAVEYALFDKQGLEGSLFVGWDHQACEGKVTEDGFEVLANMERRLTNWVDRKCEEEEECTRVYERLTELWKAAPHKIGLLVCVCVCVCVCSKSITLKSIDRHQQWLEKERERLEEERRQEEARIKREKQEERWRKIEARQEAKRVEEQTRIKALEKAAHERHVRELEEAFTTKAIRAAGESDTVCGVQCSETANNILTQLWADRCKCSRVETCAELLYDKVTPERLSEFAASLTIKRDAAYCSAEEKNAHLDQTAKRIMGMRTFNKLAWEKVRSLLHDVGQSPFAAIGELRLLADFHHHCTELQSMFVDQRKVWEKIGLDRFQWAMDIETVHCTEHH